MADNIADRAQLQQNSSSGQTEQDIRQNSRVYRVGRIARCRTVVVREIEVEVKVEDERRKMKK